MRDQATRLRHLAHDLQHERDNPSAYRIVVSGGKPGVGVTTIAANLVEVLRLDGVRAALATETRPQQADALADVLLFDASRIANPQPQLWQTADEVLLVTTPDLVAVMDTYAAIKLQLPAHQPPRLRLIVNQTMAASQTADVHQRLARSCERFLQTEIEALGEVPLDPCVIAAAEKLAPLCARYPQSAASLAIQHLAAVMARSLPRRAVMAM